jgi:hypothetical protein
MLRPHEGSEGKSEECFSDEEGYSRGYCDPYQVDHFSDDSENDEISNLDSDGCSSEYDLMDPNLKEYSESECVGVYDSDES